MFKQIILSKQRVSYGELKQKQFQFLVDQISKILAHCTIGLRHLVTQVLFLISDLINKIQPLSPTNVLRVYH